MLPRSLDEQRDEYARRRFLAMPLAGAIAWSVVAVGGATLSTGLAVWVLFIATGFIAYLGIGISRFTGEDFLDKSRPENAFDGLFFHTVFEALLVYAVAIPFFLQDPSSLPLSVGVLSGIMWVPLSWTIRHWVGLFHAGARTASVLVCWYLFPDHRFVAVPLAIVGVYAATVVILEARWRRLRGAPAA